jgi:hypothetical protein
MDAQSNATVEYFALWSCGYGGGSWFRDKDADTAVTRCLKQAYTDWKHMFNLAGVETKINLYKLTNCGSVTFGGDGVSCDEPGAEIETLPLVTRTFPKGRR